MFITPSFGWICCHSATKSRPALWPHGLQHARLPCPSLFPWVCSNSCLLSQWCCVTVSFSVTPSPFALYLSQHQGLFQWVGSSHQVDKYWSFSFSNSPSNDYSGLISFRVVWLDLLAVQGILKSLLQHHNSKASILQHSGWIWSLDNSETYYSLLGPLNWEIRADIYLDQNLNNGEMLL